MQFRSLQPLFNMKYLKNGIQFYQISKTKNEIYVKKIKY
ncbi:putative transport protein [Mannheimia haemolytica M42548]|nr:putative transport protein [Mannheimia haemolytica M42548]EEY12121.1 hypothetical protein COK_1708 [Mannheimia haemolytica serotype A2 str. BOVINE]